jgi:AcrR family transcriptional regulator
VQDVCRFAVFVEAHGAHGADGGVYGHTYLLAGRKEEKRIAIRLHHRQYHKWSVIRLSDVAARELRVDAARNRETVLAAATRAFAASEVEPSMRAIAREAGVGIATLYRHFPTRQILLEATFGGRLDSLRDEADTLASTTAPMSALVSWLRSLLHYVTEFRGLSELVMTSMRNRNSDLHASGAGMRRAGGRLLARAQETGEVRPDLDDADLILMVNGIVWAAERVPGEDHTQRLLSVMIEGLRPSHAMA